MTTHDQYVDRLSEYLDDDDAPAEERLTAAERAAIEGHLADCGACRSTLAELRAVVRIARNLPDAPPSADLWPGVSARLDPRTTTIPFRQTLGKRFTFTLPQLVAAGLALMVLSGGMVWIVRQGDPRASLPAIVATIEAPRGDVAEPAAGSSLETVSFADAQYDEAVADLEKALEAGRSRLDPETVRVIEENLASIDVAIDQARKALRNDPANVYLNTYFAASRNRKLALLRRASALAMSQESAGS